MPITLENVEFTYMAKTPYERKALQGVSLTVDKGEFVAVIGHTGSGKSTLVQHMNGLLKPSAGKVTIDGLDISGKGEAVKKQDTRLVWFSNILNIRFLLKLFLRILHLDRGIRGCRRMRLSSRSKTR